MVETVSGQKTFNFPVDEIIDEAVELVGKEFTSGLESKNLRRSLNLLLLSLQNKRVPLSTIEEVTVTLTQGQISHDLPVRVSDVLGEHGYLVRDTLDYSMNRLSQKEYMRINDKDKQDRPTNFTIDRDHDVTKVKVWPTTNQTTDSIKLLCATYIDTVTSSYELVQIPRRFYPALVSGLAYTLSKKRQNIPDNKRLRLQLDFERDLEDAMFEDGERVDMIVRPVMPRVGK